MKRRVKLVSLALCVLLIAPTFFRTTGRMEDAEGSGSPVADLLSIPEYFILVGTGQSATNEGNILLYGFDPSLANPFVYQQMIVASFAGGTVHGLDIFDYESDGDLDFVALVRFETGPHTDVWRYELFFCENIMGTHFAMTTIPDTLPDVQEAWYTGFADSTAADFDNDGDVDLVIHIGSTDPTVIYRFENTGFLPTPFVQLPFVSEDTEDWARHAKGMDSADFNGNGNADFATFDYPTAGDFNDDVIYHHGSGTPLFTFTGTYYITHNTPHAIGTITAGQFNEDSSPDVIVGGDDDGDPGQYWLYQNRGDGYFSGSSVEVFDLNPDAEPPGQSDMPGSGVGDAYDFDGDGMTDVVATAHDIPTGFTSLYFVKREGNKDFRYDTPQDFLNYPPVHTIGANLYGNVAAIAAPMVTPFGRSTFIAHFMTPEGEPYPFDVIISDGTWRKEWNDVTYIETEVPETATYTMVYNWKGRLEMYEFVMALSLGECREIEFYAINPSDIIERFKPHVIGKEVGASVSLSWQYVEPELICHVEREPAGKVVFVTGWFGAACPSNYYVLESYLVDNMPTSYDELVYTIDLEKSDERHIEENWEGKIDIEKSAVDVSVKYRAIDANKVPLGVREVLYNNTIVHPCSMKLSSLNGATFNPEFLYPQWAVLPGSYIVQVYNLPEKHIGLSFPVNISGLDTSYILDIYSPKKDELETFTFFTVAEHFFAYSSYSNLVHDMENEMLTFDVSTETNYDWWGCFVLPDTLRPEKLTAYIGKKPIDLKKWYDYTINPIDGYNLIVTRIDPSVTRLTLEYAEEEFLKGIFSSFNLRYDMVELYIRVNKEAHSNKIYGIEILPEIQQSMWESVEVIGAPEGWSFEKVGNGLKFYTETNPLLLCQRVKFTFRVKAKRISWYIRIHVTDQDHQNMGMIISTRWWLYYYPV